MSGKIAAAPSTSIERDLECFRQMCRIRFFEEKVLQLRVANEIVGSVHLCNGQEAIPVGTCSVLADQDAVFATYRGHGWALARGVPADTLFAELLGRTTGVNGGRGGSAYFSASQYGFYGENSIIGAGAPIATGAALAATFDASGRVSVTVFGEGAMNQGSVHEAMNFAAAMSLPVIFVCENNGYSELTPTKDMVRSDAFAERAASYGMPGERVDGNDPNAVSQIIAQAVDLARSGGGPSLVEAMTARLVGHYIGDAQLYRTQEELEAAQADEPLVRMRSRLESLGRSHSELADLEADIHNQIELAAGKALKAARPTVATAREHLYA